MGTFEKLGVLVIIVLVVVILVLTIWGVGVPSDELYTGAGRPLARDSVEPGRGGDLVARTPDPAPAPPPPSPWPDPEPEPVAPPPPPVPEPEPVVAPPSPEPAPAPVPAGEMVHVVKKGETLYSIARHYFGDGKHVRQILDANPGVQARSLEVGTKLRIPDSSRAQGRTPVNPVPIPASNDEYVVQRGDSLWTIAVKQYGNGEGARKIHDANRDRIGDNPDNIREGMKLRIPR